MKKGKVLCLDYGKKRVGVASGDLEDKIAFPRDVLLNKGMQELIEDVRELCEEFSVVLVVIGLPLNMEPDQLENEILQEVRIFTKELTKRLKSVKVLLFDERLSSFEAKQLIQDITEKKGTKLSKDAYEAQVILQRFFDTL